MNKLNKTLMASGTGALMIASLWGCTKGGMGGEAKLDTDKAKASYAIGQQIGGNMKGQGLDPDVPALMAGIQDGVAGKESRVKPEEVQAAMAKMQEDSMNKMSAEGDKNKKAGDDFLAQNKAKDGVKTTDSGLQYKVLSEGSGASPKDSDTVMVHYTGTLIDGKKFDSSVDRGVPAEFPVNGVIPGWTEALKLMKKGAKWQLVIPSDLAYGKTGNRSIPPNSVLLFDVELVDIKKN